jgi:hypothetical protein
MMDAFILIGKSGWMGPRIDASFDGRAILNSILINTL